MANTYTLISSNVLSASATSITFSAIPSTYTDLVLRISARSDSTFSSGIPESLVVTFNGSGASNYSKTTLYGNGANALSVRDTATANAILSFNAVGNGVTANTFGNAEIYVPSYLSSTSKPFSSFGTGENNATTAYIAANAALWNNTVAITSTTIIPGNGSNWLSSSSFYLYGIKNS